MAKEWTELTKLTGGSEITVERVKVSSSGIVIESEFLLPPLAQLPYEDQVFIMAFVGAHGSIKHMEHLFGISYPTVKNRLDKLASKLNIVEAINMPEAGEADQEDLLGMLERGEITAAEAIRKLKQ